MEDNRGNSIKRQPLCYASQPFGSAEPTVLIRYLQLGYKKVKDGKMQLTLGPDKREKTVFTQEDYLIVIAED